MKRMSVDADNESFETTGTDECGGCWYEKSARDATFQHLNLKQTVTDQDKAQ